MWAAVQLSLEEYRVASAEHSRRGALPESPRWPTSARTGVVCGIVTVLVVLFRALLPLPASWAVLESTLLTATSMVFALALARHGLWWRARTGPISRDDVGG